MPFFFYDMYWLRPYSEYLKNDISSLSKSALSLSFSALADNCSDDAAFCCETLESDEIELFTSDKPKACSPIAAESSSINWDVFSISGIISSVLARAFSDKSKPNELMAIISCAAVRLFSASFFYFASHYSKTFTIIPGTCCFYCRI